MIGRRIIQERLDGCISFEYIGRQRACMTDSRWYLCTINTNMHVDMIRIDLR